MRNNRWGLIPLALCLALSLAGCSRKAPEETGDGMVISSYSSDDYQTLLPHELSEGRYWRGNTNSRFDLMQMPKERPTDAGADHPRAAVSRIVRS